MEEDRELEFALLQMIGIYYLDHAWKDEMFLNNPIKALWRTDDKQI